VKWILLTAKRSKNRNVEPASRMFRPTIQLAGYRHRERQWRSPAVNAEMPKTVMNDFNVLAAAAASMGRDVSINSWDGFGLLETVAASWQPCTARRDSLQRDHLPSAEFHIIPRYQGKLWVVIRLSPQPFDWQRRRVLNSWPR